MRSSILALLAAVVAIVAIVLSFPLAEAGDDPFGDGAAPIEAGSNPFGEDEEPPADNPFGGGTESDPFGPAPEGVPKAKPNPAQSPKQEKPSELEIQLAPLPKEAGPAEEATWEDHLQRRVTMDVKDERLDDVVEAIAEQVGKSIRFDHNAFDEIGFEYRVPVRLKLTHGASLETALRLLRRQIDPDAAFYVHGDALILTTDEERQETRVQYQFPVKDLLPVAEWPRIEHVWSDSRRTNFRGTSEWLTELIEGLFYPDRWDKVGGPWSLDYVKGTIIVSAGSDRLEQEITELLDQLRKAMTWDGRDAEVLRKLMQRDDPWKALDKRVSLDFDAQPLDEVLEHLVGLHGEEIVVDRLGLDLIGLDSGAPVSIQAKEVTLRQALKLILRGIDPELVLIRFGDVFLITSRDLMEETLEHLSVRVYPIRDLVANQAEADELEESLESLVAPETWIQTGGHGRIWYYGPAGALVVLQSDEVFHELNHTLADLRANIAKQVTDKPAQRPAEADPPQQAEPERVEVAVLGEVEVDTRWPIVAYHIDFPPLVEKKPGAERQFKSPNDLVPLVRRLIGEKQWEHEHAALGMTGGQLVVWQSPEVHRRVEDLLRRLELLRIRPGFSPGGFR